MASRHSDELNRVSAESHAMTTSARAACEQSGKQIKWSHEVVACSLELLRQNFTKLHD